MFFLFQNHSHLGSFGAIATRTWTDSLHSRMPSFLLHHKEIGTVSIISMRWNYRIKCKKIEMQWIKLHPLFFASCSSLSFSFSLSPQILITIRLWRMLVGKFVYTTITARWLQFLLVFAPRLCCNSWLIFCHSIRSQQEVSNWNTFKLDFHLQWFFPPLQKPYAS